MTPPISLVAEDPTTLTHGRSGELLDRQLGSAGIQRSQVNYLKRGDPLLGETNVQVLLGRELAHSLGKGLDDWRGTLFLHEGRKSLLSYHPADCLKNFDWVPLLRFDLMRAREEMGSPELVLPVRDLPIRQSREFYQEFMERILRSKLPVSCDIEGTVARILCISYATSPGVSVTVPFYNKDGTPYWESPLDLEILWKLTVRIMEDPDVATTWQNGLYDRFVWLRNGVLVRGNRDDTMLKFWEWNPEFPKALAFQTSILTREPYYKSDYKSDSYDVFSRYCALDSAVTCEINDKLETYLTPKQHEHYRLNHELLEPLLYIQNKGIRYNKDMADERSYSVNSHIGTWQHRLNTEAEKAGQADLSTPAGWDGVVSLTCKKKRKGGVVTYLEDQPKKDFAPDYATWKELLQRGEPLTEQEQGNLSMWLGTHLNTKSPKFKDFLYKTLKLPIQWKKNPKTKEMRPTTNYMALLKLTKVSDHPALRAGLELSRLRTRHQMLQIVPYEGRMHCSNNIVGTESGRISCSKANLFSGDKRVGGNLTTTPDDWDIDDVEHPLAQGMRDLYLPDEGFLMGKSDLKGADGWTLGAQMAYIGDPTLLDDLKFGIKPAQVVAYCLTYGASDVVKYAHDRPALKELCKKITSDCWQYFVAKQVTWGEFYLMGPRKAAEQVFIESDGKVVLSERQAKDFKAAVSIRYKANLLHRWMEDKLSRQGYPAVLNCPDGSSRKFYGRNFKGKCEILGEALAHTPQVVTTHFIKLALRKLWRDPENWPDTGEPSVLGTPRVQPLLTVHDELLTQFRREDLSFYRRKVREWFDNTIWIENQQISIPFSGKIGTAWSMDKTHLIEEL